MYRFALSIIAGFGLAITAVAQRPNVVFIITDDQGYGDLGFTGNPVIKTPNLDRLIGESAWMKDYHVAPSCSPTRSSLLTGRWTNRTGVWHTFFARAMMYEDEVTIADHLQAAGYATAMYGKWHLGDHYPFRPQDRGFDEVFCMEGGAIGVTADHWNNDYFDDHYLHNGQYVKTKGYNTDVFFQQASSFIKEQVAQKMPFFAYISTPAPHKPWICPPEYSKRYSKLSKNLAAFYGMISNIDDNVGKLRTLLGELGVSDNTIFIFTTDNGSVTPGGYNAGMRGKKISPYEGGHRVPFAIHWPAGGFKKHQSIEELTHMVDVLPTLLELCGVKPQPSKAIDGHSWMELLHPQGTPKFNWDTRVVISDSQRVQVPKKWKDSSVMSGKWRLINGKELYNIGDDPGQKKDVAKQHPERVEALRRWYEDWWTELEPTFLRTSDHYIGAPEQPEVVLTALQWIDVAPVWNQGMIRQGSSFGKKGGARIGQKGGKKGKKGKKAKGSSAAKPAGVFPGHWTVKVVQDGTYSFEVRRWPKESGLKICEGVPAHAPLPGCLPSFSNVTGRALPIIAATLRIDGKDLETKPVTDADDVIRFTHTLKTGQYKFSPYFTQQSKSGGPENRGLGCYYMTVRKVGN